MLNRKSFLSCKNQHRSGEAQDLRNNKEPDFNSDVTEESMQRNGSRTMSAQVLICTFLLTMAGCASGGLSPREKGTLGGAALGAGAGAIIGEATDHSPGKGALIGGALGGLGGALTGNAMQSQDESTLAQQRELERQRYELERQRRETEDLRRDRYYSDEYYGRDRYRDPYYDSKYPRY